MLLFFSALLIGSLASCTTSRSTGDMESTIVARVVATLESAKTAPVATLAPPDPTATLITEPTATPVPEPTATPSPQPTTTRGPTITPPPVIEAEEYAVYSAMIEQNPVGYDLGSTILIRQQTVSDLDMFERTPQVRPLPAQLEDSYRSRNAASYTLEPHLDMELDYTLVPEKEFKEIFGRGGSAWARLQEKYPEARGVVSFSRVGFGAMEDEALVLMGFSCGDLCGAGGLYLLVKEEGTWQVQETLLVWIS
jgi:hypothetical protein